MSNSESHSPKKQPVALITGASQGIGAQIAHQLAGMGYCLFLCARNTEKLKQLQAQLLKAFPDVQVAWQACDVRQAQQVEACTNACLERFGSIEVLINNAGIAPSTGLLQEASIEEIDATIDTNLKGAIYAMRAVLPSMVQQQRGTIININSIAGKTAYPFWSIYDASKFGLTAVTEAVSEEQRANNIKVVGLYPGAVDTAIWDGLGVQDASQRQGMLTPEQIAEAVAYILQQPDSVLIKELTITPLKQVV